MATLQQRLSSLITSIKTETKAIRTIMTGTNNGTASSLDTTATNIISAINEVKITADAAAGGGVAINDASTSGTTVWSSSKTNSEIAAQLNTAIDGAPAALDTLNELAASLGDDPSFAATMTTALGNKANSSDVYTQAELGDPDTDLVALWVAA